MECISSSVSTFSGSEHKTISDNSETKILNERLNPSASSSNWISGDVALHVLLHAKYCFAMQYITNLLTEHPSWPGNITPSSEIQYSTLLSTFENKLNTGLSCFEQKYSLSRDHLIDMVFTYLSTMLPYYQIMTYFLSKKVYLLVYFFFFFRLLFICIIMASCSLLAICCNMSILRYTENLPTLHCLCLF